MIASAKDRVQLTLIPEGAKRFRVDDPHSICDRHLIRWSQMMKRFYTVYATLILFAVPTLALRPKRMTCTRRLTRQAGLPGFC